MKLARIEMFALDGTDSSKEGQNMTNPTSCSLSCRDAPAVTLCTKTRLCSF